jgi:S-adenosylmethionine-diacylglycerol 3-amino-3-carboxypropyl transferase
MLKSIFFTSLVYSAAYEDGRSELESLHLNFAGRAICVTGSGARPLDLLLGNYREILAVDFNSAQSALLELKMAAYRALEAEEMLQFLGVKPSLSRLQVYRALRLSLTDSARAHWDLHLKDLEQGVIYAGRWEQFFRLLASVFGRLRSKQIDRLFACTTVEEQAEYWERQWEGTAWSAFLRIAFQRWLWVYVLKEPGAKLIGREVNAAKLIGQCFARAARHGLFRDSPWAWLVFRGKYDADAALPLHLQPAHHRRIRERLDRIQIITDSVTTVLASQPADSIDAFSISDISSYASAADHALLWKEILRSAKPGAKICERRFLVRYPTDKLEATGLVRNRSLEQRLELQDDSVVYDFVVGTLKQKIGLHGATDKP